MDGPNGPSLLLFNGASTSPRRPRSVIPQGSAASCSRSLRRPTKCRSNHRSGERNHRRGPAGIWSICRASLFVASQLPPSKNRPVGGLFMFFLSPQRFMGSSKQKMIIPTKIIKFSIILIGSHAIAPKWRLFERRAGSITIVVSFQIQLCILLPHSPLAGTPQ